MVPEIETDLGCKSRKKKNFQNCEVNWEPQSESISTGIPMELENMISQEFGVSAAGGNLSKVRMGVEVNNCFSKEKTDFASVDQMKGICGGEVS